MHNPVHTRTGLCYIKTMTMLVQRYLATRTFAELEAEHGVKSRIFRHKVSLNYSQLEARDDDRLAQECRGLILCRMDGQSIDADAIIGETRVLARPFDRFFNLGQGAAADMNFEDSGTRFYEKMDGTMCILYFDDVKSEWHVATRAVAEANLFIDGFEEYTFRTLFERAVKDTTGQTFNEFVSVETPCSGCCYCPHSQLAKNFTYIFELTTPVNRIVVPYETYGITLLGVRINSLGTEIDPIVWAGILNVPSPEIFKLSSLTDMVDFVSGRDPKGYEGIVACDSEYRRVKVKNAGYLALNKIRDNAMNSPRSLMELVLLEKLDDAIPLIPDVVIERALAMREGVRSLMREHGSAYAACMDTADTCSVRSDERAHRKTFAIAVQTSGGWMAPMMAQYTGRTSGLRDFIDSKRSVGGGWPASFLDSLIRLTAE